MFLNGHRVSGASRVPGKWQRECHRPSYVARCILSKVKLAFVGTGELMLKYYLPEASENPGLFEIVGICDESSERAETLARFVGAPEWFSDYTELLSQSSADMVAVLASPDVNYAVALASVEAGKHVYVEKPFAPTLADADHLLQKATDSGLQVMAAPTLMLDPSNALIRSLISNGSIGQVAFASVSAKQASELGTGHYSRFLQQLAQAEISLVDESQEGSAIPWYFDAGRGPVIDSAIDAITRITGLIGPARRVTAFSGLSAGHREALQKTGQESLIDTAQDDTTLLLLDFGDSRYGYINSSWFGIASQSPGLEIIGSGGSIAVTSSRESDASAQEIVVHVFHEKTARWDEFPLTEGLWRIPSGLTHLGHCLLEGNSPDTSVEHARHVVEVVEKTYIAARTGQAQDITTTF